MTSVMDMTTALISKWAEIRTTTNDVEELKKIEAEYNALYSEEPLWSIEDVYQAGI